jgi:hypothetical protein
MASAMVEPKMTFSRRMAAVFAHSIGTEFV